VDLTYSWRGEDGEEQKLPVRALAVHSSALEQRKRGAVERRKAREEERLGREAAKLAKRSFHCEKDAWDGIAALRESGCRFHALEAAVRWEEVPAKRARSGRPKKGEPAPTKKIWRVDVDVSEVPGAVEEVLFEESCFVLATNLPRSGAARAASDAEVLQAYEEQHTVEGCMRWAKGPLAVAPIFLKTPLRIAALSAVYVLALMVYALIQREVRRRLAAEGTTMPGNRGQGWTAKPTTEVVFRLFEGIDTLRGVLPDGAVVVTNTNTEQIRLLRLLGHALLETPGVVFAEPRVPRPGERAWKPVPRTAAEKARRAETRRQRRRKKR